MRFQSNDRDARWRRSPAAHRCPGRGSGRAHHLPLQRRLHRALARPVRPVSWSPDPAWQRCRPHHRHGADVRVRVQPAGAVHLRPRRSELAECVRLARRAAPGERERGPAPRSPRDGRPARHRRVGGRDHLPDPDQDHVGDLRRRERGGHGRQRPLRRPGRRRVDTRRQRPKPAMTSPAGLVIVVVGTGADPVTVRSSRDGADGRWLVNGLIGFERVDGVDEVPVGAAGVEQDA
jgi:hypothetical protein